MQYIGSKAISNATFLLIEKIARGEEPEKNLKLLLELWRRNNITVDSKNGAPQHVVSSLSAYN